jgi:divalent metal cation (Fe/Co/Zn/Cd) transporter
VPGSLVGGRFLVPHSRSAAGDLQSGLRVSVLSIGWTVVSSAVAIVSGITASDLVLVAFGCTGLLDAAGSTALVIHFRHALRHERFSERHERVAFLVVNTGLVVVALATAAESIQRLVSGTHGEASSVGMFTAAVSSVVLTFLARRKMVLGRSIPSHALFSDGMLSATGAVLAVVTVIGTALISLGLWWADPVAALVVAAGALAVAVILARE